MGLRHLQIAKGLGLDVAGVADSRPEALAQATRDAGVPPGRCFTDPAALLDSARPECVIIATTAPAHEPLTCLASERGARYVLCEKPMASSLAGCDRMIKTCEHHGTRLAINHQMRFMEQYLEVRKIIDGEAFGGWASVTVVAGNFGLAMNGTHYFELFRWLARERIREACAWLSPDKVPNPRGPQFEDTAGAVRLTTAGGKRLTMEIGPDQGHGVQVIYAGRCGVVVADELAGRISSSVRLAEHRSLPTTRYGMPAEHRVIDVPPADVLGPTRAVLEALLAGKDVPGGQDGRAAVEALVACHVSHEQGHLPVTLDGSLPGERTFSYA
jgi:predicted dehydrogenase